jgi:hypothetical protein
MVGRRACRSPRPYYTFGHENHEIIFVACLKCEWKAAFVREELIPTDAIALCRAYSLAWLILAVLGGNRCGALYVDPIDGRGRF